MKECTVLKAYGKYKPGDVFNVPDDPYGVFEEFERMGFINMVSFYTGV